MSQAKTIPVEKIHISQTNVRANLPFGDSEEDKALVYQVNWGKKVVQPFKVRPEKDGYGVYVGRRRFLAKKAAGFKEFVIGDDVIIEDIDEAEARRQSLVENLDFLRKEMDPMTRAHELAKLVDNSTGGLRVVAGQLGIPPTTLSEWLKVLDLAPKMQETVSKGLLSFSDGLQLVRMDLGEKTQEKLADVLETEGKEEFEKELERHAESKLKRGLPKGKYFIVRTVFDRVYPPDLELYEKLEKMAEAKHVQIDDYCKNVLKEHVAQQLKS
jgi:ParB/RepB/Spo0J family partition protein